MTFSIQMPFRHFPKLFVPLILISWLSVGGRTDYEPYRSVKSEEAIVDVQVGFVGKAGREKAHRRADGEHVGGFGKVMLKVCH